MHRIFRGLVKNDRGEVFDQGRLIGLYAMLLSPLRFLQYPAMSSTRTQPQPILESAPGIEGVLILLQYHIN